MVREVILLGTSKAGQLLYTDELGRPLYIARLDSQGRVFVNAAGSYAHITETRTISLVAGYLHAITVNGGTLGGITVYDSKTAAGKVIAALDTLNRQTYIYDILFSTGLTVALSAAADITISYAVTSGSGLLQITLTDSIAIKETKTVV